jgi:hypothetical protein
MPIIHGHCSEQIRRRKAHCLRLPSLLLIDASGKCATQRLTEAEVTSFPPHCSQQSINIRTYGFNCLPLQHIGIIITITTKASTMPPIAHDCWTSLNPIFNCHRRLAVVGGSIGILVGVILLLYLIHLYRMKYRGEPLSHLLNSNAQELT